MKANRLSQITNIKVDISDINLAAKSKNADFEYEDLIATFFVSKADNSQIKKKQDQKAKKMNCNNVTLGMESS